MPAPENPLLVLARTASGTPMGTLLRRYWLPVLLAEELPAPDCPPLRVKLLSEQLIAFRDSAGGLGLIDEFCAHRGASLWFGRNEEGGLRCAYHGWKFDTSGQCLEVPSEPPENSTRQRIRLRSYPLVERGGILWAYLGDPRHRPPAPAYEFTDLPATHRFASKRIQQSNYLPALEGGLDPFHLAYLHRGEFAGNVKFASPGVRQFMRHDLPLRMDVATTPGGLLLANGREGATGVFWRVMQWIMPTVTLIPPFGDAPVHGHAWVPIDDETCWVWTFEYHPTRPLEAQERATAEQGEGLHVKVEPGTYTPLANRDNAYFMDRDRQRRGILYSGIPGIGTQDAAMQENMAPLEQRTEHLVSIDRFIVQARRRLREAADIAGREEGAPPGTDPSSQQVRSASVILPPGRDVFDAVAGHVRTVAGTTFLTE